MLATIQMAIHSRFLQVQKINRIVNSDKFEEAYEKATIEQRLNAENIVESLNKGNLLGWIKTMLHDDYLSYNMRDLRLLGRELGILNYNFLSKDSLLSAIYTRKTKIGA